MGLRALVGVADTSGAFRARTVELDGCPTVIVPALTHLIHQVHGGDVDAPMRRLMSHHWRQLHLLPATFGHRPEVVARPTGQDGPPVQGRLDLTPAGEHAWAYLVTDQRLHIYLGVDADTTTRVWTPWACWAVRELPNVRRDELLTVQRDGYATQWRATQQRGYAQAKQERFAGDGR